MNAPTRSPLELAVLEALRLARTSNQSNVALSLALTLEQLRTAPADTRPPSN